MNNKWYFGNPRSKKERILKKWAHRFKSNPASVRRTREKFYSIINKIDSSEDIINYIFKPNPLVSMIKKEK